MQPDDLTPDRIRAIIREEIAAAMPLFRAELRAVELGDDALVSKTEAARHLGVSLSTLDRMRRNGELRGGRIGGVWEISMGELRGYMREVGDGKRVRLR